MLARRIDRYQILEEVGSGGMAVVYKGIDTRLDRVVAVKVLHPHLASREESRRRFSREAQAVARLRHPGIVEIFDYSGADAPEAFIVTEFVSGATLRAFGDRHGFALPELAVLVAARLASALAHAHEAGIVHRDLKPENVMVGADGSLKLMDFGIARMISGDERMTMTGALVGSPLHMAPEIIEGREAREPADVFALGTILYWMVTGQMAFAGNNTTQTLRRILEGEYTDPRVLAPACSDAIAELVARCLRRDPAERPASMAGLRDELEALAAPLLRPDERLEETLRAFLLDPDGFVAQARPRLVASLVAQGEAALAARRPALALAHFNRVLALDEQNAAVRRHLERMRRRRVLRRRLGWAGGALLLAAAILPVALALRGGSKPEAPATPVDEPLAVQLPPPAPQPAPVPQPAPTPVPAAEPPAAEEAPLRPGPAAEPTPAPAAAPAPAPVRPPESEPEPLAMRQEPPAPVRMQRVQLRWVPQGARLSIDGAPVDTVAPAWNGELAAGAHTFTLTHPDCCKPWEETIELDGSDELVRRSVALAPLDSGWFEVSCDHPDAEVWFEGTFKGTVAQVNERGGVPVAFSRDDPGRDRYVKTVRFQVLPPRGRRDLVAASAEVVVRAGQTARSPQVVLEAREP